MKNSPLVLVLITTLFLSCGESGKSTFERYAILDHPMSFTDDFYASGELVFYVHEATFTDCLTGRTFPVCQEGDYLNAERQYTALPKSDMQPYYAFMRGYLRRKRTGHDVGDMKLVITDFGKFDTLKRCTSEMYLPGNYVETLKKKHPQTHLTIFADYTFQKVCYDADQKIVEVLDGYWGRVEESVLIFISTDGNHNIACINWDKHELNFSDQCIFIRTD